MGDLSFLLCPEFHNPTTVDLMLPILNDTILNSDILFTVSKSTEYDLIKYYQLPEEKVHTVYCGPSLTPNENFLDSCDVNNLELKFGKRLKVLFLATFEPRKNHAILFELISSFPWVLDFYQFVLVGAEGWGPTLDELAYSYGVSIEDLGESLTYSGYVTEDEKSQLINSADVILYPSFFEGFGM